MTPIPFSPPFWLRNPHIQTLWPKLFRPLPALPLRRERLELADGDFIDLAWATDGTGPPVLILHGLEGTLRSHYALPVMATLLRAGGRPVAAAIGFSLGGNLLLRYLGATGSSALLQAAVAVSVPFVLADAARRLEQGGSRIYQHYLMTRLKRTYRQKFTTMASPLRVDLDRIRTLWEYDQWVTAPLNGFDGADDYYARCSSLGYLKDITVPTLILHSTDDPFMYPHNVPRADQVGPGVRLAIQSHGGHVGFIEGRFPWRTGCLIDRLAPAFFTEHLTAADPLP